MSNVGLGGQGTARRFYVGGSWEPANRPRLTGSVERKVPRASSNLRSRSTARKRRGPHITIDLEQERRRETASALAKL
jgi:hypothetical protein